VATTAAIPRSWPNPCLIWSLTLGFGSLFHLKWREETRRCSGEACESLNGTPAVIGVAIMIAVEQPGSNFPQKACSDWLTAQHTRGLLAGRPVIHQYEFQVAPPSAKQTRRRMGGRNSAAERTDDSCRRDCLYSVRLFPAESECTFCLPCVLRRCCRRCT
jgi:hypothetical protein